MAANATEKSKTLKTKEENLGIAAANLKIGEKDKEILIDDYSKMKVKILEEYSLCIGELKTHECVYDERKKIAKRIMEDGTEIEAKPEKFEKIVKAIRNKGKDRD